jgi:hypothetical protein
VNLLFGLRASQSCEACHEPLSASDVFLTVTIMSITFLIEVGFIEVGFFTLIGKGARRSGQRAADARV